MINDVQRIIGGVRQWLVGGNPVVATDPAATIARRAQPIVTPGLPLRVLVVTYNPTVDASSGTRLASHMGWFDPHQLVAAYAEDVAACSHGNLTYEIVAHETIDGFPAHRDGHRYTLREFLDCWERRTGFHTPDESDYDQILASHDVITRINDGDIDELWIMAPPYSGFYESHMAGPGAFWCNSPGHVPGPHLRGVRASRRFVVMGFNYEREVGCMLENLGHRTESMLSEVYRGMRGGANLWERFTNYEQVAPGRAALGNVHFAPNSTHDYDWGNRRPVMSECDSWLTFPALDAPMRRVTCGDWGGGDMREHHLWWFRHLPHAGGETNGVSNNWWDYVRDPNLVNCR